MAAIPLRHRQRTAQRRRPLETHLPHFRLFRTTLPILLVLLLPRNPKCRHLLANRLLPLGLPSNHCPRQWMLRRQAPCFPSLPKQAQRQSLGSAGNKWDGNSGITKRNTGQERESPAAPAGRSPTITPDSTDPSRRHEGDGRSSHDKQQPSVPNPKIPTQLQPAVSQSTVLQPQAPPKSVIPSTLTPNPSFGLTFPSAANTKPKYKSPLGSQPPIIAAENASKAATSQESEIDSRKVTRNLATIAFLEPHGILQQYIEYTAAPLIEEAMHQFEQEQLYRAARRFPSLPEPHLDVANSVSQKMLVIAT
jgi:hypothetical protein